MPYVLAMPSCGRQELLNHDDLECSLASSCSLFMSALAMSPSLEDPGDLYSRKSRTPSKSPNLSHSCMHGNRVWSLWHP